MRRAAQLNVSGEMLRKVFGFPETVTIRSVRYNAWTNRFEFLLEGEEFPPLPEGCVPPIIEAEYEAAGRSFMAFRWGA